MPALREREIASSRVPYAEYLEDVHERALALGFELPELLKRGDADDLDVDDRLRDLYLEVSPIIPR